MIPPDKIPVKPPPYMRYDVWFLVAGSPWKDFGRVWRYANKVIARYKKKHEITSNEWGEIFDLVQQKQKELKLKSINHGNIQK